MGDLDRVACREKDRPFDAVLQLPHIPRPMVGQEDLGHLRGDLPDRFPHLFGVLHREVVGQEEDVAAPVPQGGQVDGKDAEAVEEIRRKRPTARSCSRFRLVAVMIRTSTRITRCEPRGWNCFSWRTRRTLAWAEAESSPTSSRKIVPPLASSKRPRRWWMAPVKAPRSWPKSSLSMRVSGMAAQLLDQGPLRWAVPWIARATAPCPSCLAVDQDGRVGVGHLGQETKTSCITLEWPMISSRADGCGRRSSQAGFSSSWRGSGPPWPGAPHRR
jgi:hypothetical protein